MKREILFRGKRLDNGEWVDGNLIIFPKTKRIKIMVWEWADLDFNAIEVRPKTVGQYTGLTDKNGQKIFEGDIIQAQFRSNHSHQTFRIIFKDGMFLFDNNYVKVPRFDIYRLRVVGNIHDNPELLEG